MRMKKKRRESSDGLRSERRSRHAFLQSDDEASADGPASGVQWTALRRYADVARALAMRDFRSRHRANHLGPLPAIAVPLLFLATYSFVFSTLIPVRLRPEADRADYALFLFSGLIAWNLFAEAAISSPRTYVDRAHFIRTALFPASTLPVSAALAAYYRSLLWLATFALFSAWQEGIPSAPLLFAPLILLMVALFAAGVAIALAVMGAFLRDIAELTPPILTVAFFLSPILVPAERLIQVEPWLVWSNPLAPALRSLHRILLEGGLPEPRWIAAAAAWSLVSLLLGAILHHRLRPGLGDRV